MNNGDEILPVRRDALTVGEGICYRAAPSMTQDKGFHMKPNRQKCRMGERGTEESKAASSFLFETVIVVLEEFENIVYDDGF